MPPRSMRSVLSATLNLYCLFLHQSIKGMIARRAITPPDIPAITPGETSVLVVETVLFTGA